jgi:hypothetical protein
VTSADPLKFLGFPGGPLFRGGRCHIPSLEFSGRPTHLIVIYFVVPLAVPAQLSLLFDDNIAGRTKDSFSGEDWWSRMEALLELVGRRDSF